MKKIITALLSLLLLTGCAGTADGSGGSYIQLSSDQAMEQMASSEGYIILDVRTKEEYDSGHIAGAVNLPLQDLADGPPALLPDLSQEIYVYCRSGNRSKQASQILAELGYTNVFEFGGIHSWKGEIVK